MLSPEQISAKQPQSLLASMYPWTPIEFVNAWLKGEPSGNRPQPGETTGILLAGREASDVLLQHLTRAQNLIAEGVEFRNDRGPYLDQINALLSETGRRVSSKDERGVIFALHPRDGVVGTLVVTAGSYDDQVAMFINAVVVEPAWRHRGVGSVLETKVKQLLPSDPDITVGHCAPETAQFFAQLGFTVLRPGEALPLPVPAEAQPVLNAIDGEVYFYRQGPV